MRAGVTVYSSELPGMITEGDTLEAAECNVREALELYVESMRDRSHPSGATSCAAL